MGNIFRCLQAVDSFKSMPPKMHGIDLLYRFSKEVVDLPPSQIISLKEEVKDRLMTVFGEYDSVKVRVRIIFSSIHLSSHFCAMKFPILSCHWISFQFSFKSIYFLFHIFSSDND